MANLTTRHIRRNALVYLGLATVSIATLVSACETEPSGIVASGGQGGSTAGAMSSGGAGTSSAGTSNQAGLSGIAGTLPVAGSASNGGSAGSAGSAGTGGTGGSGGSGGSAGNGGSGGMACAADDQCCDDPNKTAPGMCGCGVPDADDDNDGQLNCKEQCPTDPNKTEPGTCGCGVAENDSDGDGIIDCKPGHFYEAEDGVLSHVDVAVTPVDTGAGGAGGDGGAGGAGGAASSPDDFTIGNDVKASKGKYIESPSGFTSDGLPGPARATYTIDIPVATKYVIWARVYTPSSAHNRFWIKVDDGVWTKQRVTSGQTWFWYVVTVEGMFAAPIQYDFTKGTHTLAVASDSDQVGIDRFYVTPGADRPPGDDTVCDPPNSIQVGDVCQSSCGMLQGTSCDAVMCAGKTLLPAYDCAVCCTL